MSKMLFQRYIRYPLTSPLLHLFILLIACAGSAGAQKKPEAQPQIGSVTIDKFKELIWKPEVGYFKSPGPVRIILEDAKTGEKTVILADDAEGQENGDIIVHGAVRVERNEGILTGRSLTYNGADQAGTILQARVESGTMTLTGEKVDLLPGRVLRATNASVTTCVKARPDYHITARQIQVNAATGKVNAKNVTMWLGRTRIISLPSIQRSFGGGSGGSMPLPGYSSNTGIHLRFGDQSIAEPHRNLEYEILISAKQSVAGAINFQQDIRAAAQDVPPPRSPATLHSPLISALERTPPPTLQSIGDIVDEHQRTSLFALLQANLPVYNRVRSDLKLSRLPEFGVRFSNFTGRSPAAVQEVQQANLARARHREWLLNSETSIGYFTEFPMNTRAARLALRADAAGPFTPIGGGLHLRYGATVWASGYSPGAAYLLTAPEIELDFLLTKNSLLGAKYRYEQSAGTTPFIFDRRDIRHEAAIRYGFLNANWGLDVSVDYDLERKRNYDSSIAIRRRMDCLEYGLAYRTRSQSINLIFNILPATRGVRRTAAGLPAGP